MVIRQWRGRAANSAADAYPRHFRRNVVPALRKVPGFLGAHLGQRRCDDKVEYLVLTRWHSMDAIRGFAGTDVDRAIVEPQAVAALTDFDQAVDHFEVIEEI